MPKRPSVHDDPSNATRDPSSSQGGASGAARATAPGLHLVATPIGNLRDITLRALDTLRDAAVVACEDTRVTRKLLTAHNLTTPLTAYHDHNAERARPGLIKRLESGQIVALVSDAGTPLISDPGYRLVREAVARGIPVTAVPGPSSPLAALVVSGLPSDRFHFAGYLPARKAARRAALAELGAVGATLILLEATRRLPESLADMAEVLGPRDAAIGRELTKRNEEVARGTLAALASRYAEAGAPRGEAVVVIAPPEPDAPASENEIDAALADALAVMSVRDAAASVAAAIGAPKRRVYERALARARERGK